MSYKNKVKRTLNTANHKSSVKSHTIKSKNTTNINPDSHNVPIDDLNNIDEFLFPKGFSTKIISHKPYIVKIRRFLDSSEIDTLLDMAKGLFEKSTIVVDGKMVNSTSRTSQTAFITDNGNYGDYNKNIDKILNKVCYLMDCKRNQIESLMVVKYRHGNEYQEHHDYFIHDEVIADEGNRCATFFCYLNSLDSDEGGETEFPEIKVKVKPSKGTAVFWWDMDSRNKVIPDTLHRGNPVLSKNKTKYGLNIWIREYGW